MAKPLATFSIRPVVRVIIRGQRGEGESFPTVRDDSLLSELREFLREASIYPAVREGTSGPGIHVGYYSAEDAERIHTWLRDHGAKRTEFMG